MPESPGSHLPIVCARCQRLSPSICSRVRTAGPGKTTTSGPPPTSIACASTLELRTTCSRHAGLWLKSSSRILTVAVPLIAVSWSDDLPAVAGESSNRLRRVEAVQHRRLTVHEGCAAVAAGRCGRSLRPRDWERGLGMNLPFCRRVIGGHGGTIMLQSDATVGYRGQPSARSRRSDVVSGLAVVTEIGLSSNCNDAS